MNNFFIVFFFGYYCITQIVFAQFAPPVGEIGTTAMYKDSSAFVAWAGSASIVRGLQDVAIPASGYATIGDSTSALGIAGTTDIVSLGDGGYAILQFDKAIMNGEGPDFAVFENGFNDTFLELAFVEVSSDGQHYFRFPATSNTDTILQTDGFGSTDASLIHNLAGKYRALYGTPFDLSDLNDTILLNKEAITHVKIIDVIGSMQTQYCSRDKNNHKINDPWPTPYTSSGFDLDAVGVIHQQNEVGIFELKRMKASIFPNPVKDILNVSVGLKTNYSILITTIMGEEVFQNSHASGNTTIEVGNLKQGLYLLTLFSENQKQVLKFIKF